MQRIIRRISTTVYALGVVGALTFGASQAFGRAVYLTCPYDPPTWLGACITPPPDPTWECTQRCQAITGDSDSQGRCDVGGAPGCCVCLMR